MASELESKKLNSVVSCLVASEAWEGDTLFDLIYHNNTLHTLLRRLEIIDTFMNSDSSVTVVI